ncbi:MAG: SDR family NAD(P)-dependent oxidoreductase [Planctomycetota bacterium]|jgi:NADP-dependent 3-hydroxy acid dehydrogenase YdfG
MTKHILITGASAGIGAAIARRLATGDNVLSLGARRVERLPEVVEKAFHRSLDVADESSVEQFLAAAIAANGPIDALVNNAGLARGIEPVADADGRAWREMIETNLFGVLHMTRRVLPAMVERGTGHIVMLGSIAARETYAGASVYCATKRALQSITEAIRLETLGSGVRITSIDPGLVQTEFSLVRFAGDEDKARQPYLNTRTLTAEDVAECVEFTLSRPAHVNIDSILVMPTDQAGPRNIHRAPPD